MTDTAMFNFDGATLSSPVVSDTVIRTGKYFECGQEFTDMTGKKFGLTEAEADAVLPSFTGGDLNLEHMPTVLDGSLGRVNRLWREGKDILAEYAIPKWLHEATKAEPLKVSSEWDTSAKKPLGAALALKPAVKDAVMMSAFSEGAITADSVARFAGTRHNTPEGQIVMQDLHDMSARAGAVCDRTNADKAKMASQHESSTIQKIHDLTTDHGATCHSGEAPSWSKSMYSEGDKPMPEKTPWYAKLIPALTKAGVPEADVHASFSAVELPAAELSESDKARFTALEAENARLRTAHVTRDAETFADAQIAASRAVPGERANIVALFTQAAEDDAAAPRTVKFSAPKAGGGTELRDGTRVDALKASFASRVPHMLTEERLRDTDALVLLSQPQDPNDIIKQAREQGREYAKTANGTRQK